MCRLNDGDPVPDKDKRSAYEGNDVHSIRHITTYSDSSSRSVLAVPDLHPFIDSHMH